MSHDTKFEDACDREFRWPRKGDQPFKKSENAGWNAEIEQRPHGRLVMMVEGYKLGAEMMVERSRNDRFDRAALVYPIIFNYRHFIELSLKYIIAIYGPSVGVEANWKTHDLSILWTTFTEVLTGYGHAELDVTDPAVSVIVAEFAKVDPGSFSFRYPVDRCGKRIPISHEELDLEALADVICGLHAYFMGCDGYLDSLQNAGP